MTTAIPAEQAVCCTSLTSEPISAQDAEALAKQLKALADPNRLRLVSMVAASESGEACVCDLTEPLDLAQPTISHHLRLLTEAGILSRTKRGTWSYYRLVPGALQGIATPLAAG
jgi:ArsR family transcriptional regulator